MTDIAIETLVALGFTEEDTHTAYFQALSDQLGMSKPDEPHTIITAMVKGDVHAVFEKNVFSDYSGGMRQVIHTNPVLILESPKGRVAVCHLDDTKLIESEVEALS